MRIAVYGATGMVGREVVAEARRRGHDVTGYARSGGEGIEAADLADTATFTQVAADHDAVVIAVSPDRTGGPHEPLLRAFDDVIASRPDTRLLVVVGAGSLQVDGGDLADAPGIPEEYRPEMRTMRAVLGKLRASEGLSWTAVSPAPEISPGERTGSYRSGTDSPVGERISSQDFAVAVLDELENPRFEGRRFTVAN